MAKPFPILDGSRVRLRTPEEHDVDRIIAFQRENREHLAPMDPSRSEKLYTRAFWEARVVSLGQAFREGRGVYLLVFRKEVPSEVIGTISFSNMVGAPFYLCEVGFAIDWRAQGLGFMREALELALPQMCERCELHRIQAHYAVGNTRSAALLARLGFVQEGVLRQYMLVDGVWQDFVAVALIRPLRFGGG